MTSTNQPCELDKAAAGLLDAIGSRMHYERMAEDARRRIDTARRELEACEDGILAALVNEVSARNELIAISKASK